MFGKGFIPFDERTNCDKFKDLIVVFSKEEGGKRVDRVCENRVWFLNMQVFPFKFFCRACFYWSRSNFISRKAAKKIQKKFSNWSPVAALPSLFLCVKP